MKIYRLLLGIIPALFLTGAPLHGVEGLLLHYPLNEGSGLAARDVGPSKLDLEVGADMGWSMKGTGLGGNGSALGAVGAKEVFARNVSADGRMDNLISYTVCGWYKLTDWETKGAVLFDLLPSLGNGLQVYLSHREEAGASQQTVVLTVGTQTRNVFFGSGVQYADWGKVYGTLNQWIFMAVTVTSGRNAGTITFYSGTESVAAKSECSFGMGDVDFALGKIQEVWLANCGGATKRPVGLGTYLRDVRLYGSASDSSGALSLQRIEEIRQEGLDAK